MDSSCLKNILHVENRIMAVAFLICLSFSITQVPLLYAFHIMACDAYFDHHPPPRTCSLDAISSTTARQYSIVGMLTTLFGTLNLLLTGWALKRIGPRAALTLQALVPALRSLVQLLGLAAGKRQGMRIIQASQVITIAGGPAGYALVINVIAGEVVLDRTSIFGKVQGCIMLGQASGFLLGGLLGDLYGVSTPFQLAFLSFLLAAACVRASIPYIPPESLSSRSNGLLAPLSVLSQRVRTTRGVGRHFGVALLCAGVFIGGLGTDCVPLLMQQYATAAFGFTQGDNGRLMAQFSFMRSITLILLFPRVMAWGRARFDAGGRFHLPFLRCSVLLDGLFTTIAALATRRWHIFLAALLVPLASGSAPVAKGVIVDMAPASRRADALNAITLVENLARMSAQGLFGFIFSSLAAQGKAYATFYCNAAIAVVGVVVLLFSQFPAEGTLVNDDDDDDDDGETAGLLQRA